MPTWLRDSASSIPRTSLTQRFSSETDVPACIKASGIDPLDGAAESGRRSGYVLITPRMSWRQRWTRTCRCNEGSGQRKTSSKGVASSCNALPGQAGGRFGGPAGEAAVGAYAAACELARSPQTLRPIREQTPRASRHLPSDPRGAVEAPRRASLRWLRGPG